MGYPIKNYRGGFLLTFLEKLRNIFLILYDCQKRKCMMDIKLNFKEPKWIAGVSAAVSGVVVHSFALVNVLHNYDNILQQPKGYGAGITSGRWFLSILGDFCENILGLGYNLSTINGLLFLAMIAVSAMLLVEVLQIRVGFSAALLGCLMATFPTVCSTMVFRYTAPYYGLSLLLSVFAVWVAGRGKLGVILSALCVAFSMGIYQAYVPFTIGIFLLVLMHQSLQQDASLLKLILQGVRYCVCLILGVVLYFVFLKIAMALYSTAGEVVLDTYQGIDSMGKISLSQLPGLIKQAWLSAALFTIRDYCGIAGTAMLKILWSGLLLLIVLMASVLLVAGRKQIWNCAFFCLMGLLFPLAINFIVVMAPEGIVYTIMVYSFVLVACAPLMLAECLPEGKMRGLLLQGIGLLSALIIFYNGNYTNLNYTRLYYANRQVENYFSGMAAQIRMTEGYTPDKKLVVLGERLQDPNMWEIWDEEPVYGGVNGSNAKGLINASYSVVLWIDNYLGVGIAQAEESEKAEVEKNPAVEEMPCWPSQGSLKVMDAYLVLKREET